MPLAHAVVDWIGAVVWQAGVVVGAFVAGAVLGVAVLLVAAMFERDRRAMDQDRDQ